MRVGLFTPNYPGVSGEGGIGTYTRNIAHALAARGHAVHVLTAAAVGEETRDGDVRVHLVRTAHLPLIDRLVPGAGACYRVSRAMQRVAARHRLDVVEFPNWEGLGLLYAWDPPTPVVVRLHTSSLETQQIDQVRPTYRARWDVRRERWLARTADVLVTHSAAHRQRMAEELGVGAERIRVIPHGIPPADGGRPGEPAAPAIVFIGRLEKRKGALDLLRAAPRVLEAFPDAQFVFIGSDRPHCPGGRTHAEYVRHELPEPARRRVVLLGRLSDGEVEGWRRRATVFAAPSVYESFGLVFLEAMRWGVPVVGTRAGGIPEVVEDGRTGLLVSPGEPGELAEAILRLLRDPALRAELGEAGRAAATERFGIGRAAERVEQLYHQTLTTWRKRLRTGSARPPASRPPNALPRAAAIPPGPRIAT